MMSTTEVVIKLAREIAAMGGKVESIRENGKRTIVIRVNGRDEVFRVARTLEKGHVKTVLVPVSSSPIRGDENG